jgi:hypothetical protein
VIVSALILAGIGSAHASHEITGFRTACYDSSDGRVRLIQEPGLRLRCGPSWTRFRIPTVQAASTDRFDFGLAAAYQGAARLQGCEPPEPAICSQGLARHSILLDARDYPRRAGFVLDLSFEVRAGKTVCARLYDETVQAPATAYICRTAPATPAVSYFRHVFSGMFDLPDAFREYAIQVGTVGEPSTDEFTGNVTARLEVRWV